MNMRTGETSIHVAFRFHGNFYHSYRGDTADELGFGKDIRVIRRILEVLDGFNEKGVPVRGTWDFENYFSLQIIMPRHCPDIVESLKRRVKAGTDEMQIMSYNNGIMNAHTAVEFDAAIERSISNADCSGVRDVFGSFAPMVRPQEMMYTPAHLSLYPRHGIQYISLYYSAIPFNAFSAFVPRLSTRERFNPLRLSAPGLDAEMVMVPAYNPGDLIDNISLRRWVKRLRREQLRMDGPSDLLLLIDMDADDEFWCGIEVPVLSRIYSMGRGLKGLIESVLDLDYVRFTTPCSYLEDHPPVGTVSLGQDTADGSFDGLASWAEKWENQLLWTGIERSRILELQALRVIDSVSHGTAMAARSLLAESFEGRLRSLSTTHFGMAAPVMNRTRLASAVEIVENSVAKAANSLGTLLPGVEGEVGGGLTLFDYTRGITSGGIHYKACSSRALMRLPLRVGEVGEGQIVLLDDAGSRVPSALMTGGRGAELCFVAETEAGGKRDFRVERKRNNHEAPVIKRPVRAEGGRLENEFLSLGFDSKGAFTGLSYGGKPVLGAGTMRAGVTYRQKRSDVTAWSTIESGALGDGLIGMVKLAGELGFGGGKEHRLRIERELALAAGLPYLYITQTVHYPKTPPYGFNPGRAMRLQQQWDTRWKEVMPCEMEPLFHGTPANPLRVWKYNHLGHMSSYELDYGKFSKNRELDSCNNHATNGWVAVSNGKRGLLIAQTAEVLCSLAFCPLRTRRNKEGLRVFMNPFGSYTGRQYAYPTKYTGLGWLVAVRFSASDHIAPYAPSYNGKTQRFRLMVAPYEGDEPPESLRADAAAFAYPYLAVGDGTIFDESPCRSWKMEKDW
ncbi:MAG: hypothetical protein MUC76_02700 [Spirochaetes bacterium]|jgi:hypothetical protein|nr:hypothetical protein [Spirochaetota bacterium]